MSDKIDLFNYIDLPVLKGRYSRIKGYKVTFLQESKLLMEKSPFYIYIGKTKGKWNKNNKY